MESEIRNSKKQNTKKGRKLRDVSLSVRLPLLFIISTLIIMIVVVVAVHFRFQSQMIKEYDRMAKGVTQLMAERIDGDKIDEYFEKNFKSKEYRSIIDYMYTLKANYPDVLYLYSYRCEKDGGHMLFDIDAEEVDNGEAFDVGYVYEMDEPFASQVDKIMAGKKTKGYAVQTKEDGYLYSYCRPVLDSNGNYACSVCVDFSLDQMADDNKTFTIRLALMILAISLVILLVEVVMVRRWVTDPINDLSICAEKFAYDTEEDRRNNIRLLDNVNITSRDEIGDVYQMLRSVTIDSFEATSHLSQAKQDIHDKEIQISEISKEAYKDKLTNVGNLAAFERDAEEVSGEYAIVMFDLNNLKHVNDTCGHGRGDLYIQGCCNMICEQYKHSPVYRIGGDEFVIILQGSDFRNREQLLKEIKAAFSKSYENDELCESDSASIGSAAEWEKYSASIDSAAEWEKYSSAVGMATAGAGEKIESVLKRADEAMYRHKEEFHQSTGISSR